MLEFPGGVSKTKELFSATPLIVINKMRVLLLVGVEACRLFLKEYILNGSTTLGSIKISSHLTPFSNPPSKEKVLYALLGVGMFVDAYKTICP